MNPQSRTISVRTIWLAATTMAVFSVKAGAADYSATVLSDGPLAYYRFNDSLTRSNINQNVGTLGAAGNATNLNLRAYPGAVAGSRNRSQFFDSTGRALIPWNAALNPPNTVPFTVEAWFYPASDQINPGQCPINNRYAYSGVDRQGWVFFQRAQNDSYAGKPGYEGVGWNFRMYRGSGGSSGLDVVSQVPFHIGRWTQVVVVYDPIDVTNASLTMYIDGVPVNTNLWSGGASGTDPGYVANTNDHDPAEAVNGPAALSLGAYNNTGLGQNPYFGAIDEFAFYSRKLTAEQILAHYRSGTNAARATAYEALVQSDNPVVHLRLDELSSGPDVAINLGNLQAAGVATHTPEVRHPATSALAGRADDGAAAYHYRNGSSTTTIPWTEGNNPNAGVPFTFETWLRPASDKQGGQCPINNRWVGGSGRTGWVIFQRNPNLTYPASEGHGWNFRMYSGAGTGGQDVLTGADYTVGKWQYLAVTWQPETDNADPGGDGNNQWTGILTAYVDGVPVATNSSARYAANVNPTETGAAPADFAVGSYNAASGLGNNAYEGDIDEVAIYTNYVLTAEQIRAHYAAGTNAHSLTNYETLVLTAAYDGAAETPQRTMPRTYLRFNEPAHYAATNSGTLGFLADGILVVATNQVDGPQPSAYAGFESSNRALSLDGTKGWASLNNPVGLNLSGQLTLEAWIKTSATLGEVRRIISHGPPTLSSFLDPPLETNASVTVAPEVFLRKEGFGQNYAVGTSDGTNNHSAIFAVPAGDLSGTNWIHLVGTYNGTQWQLYRNGVLVATNTGPGAFPVPNADWAIGATGNGWEQNFAGAIDEVAIYNRALTADRIQAHYAAGLSDAAGPAPMITITRSGNSVILAWPRGLLQEAVDVNGPYNDLPNATSPYTTPADAPTRFYRVRQ